MFGYENFVTFIDECTRMTSVYIIKNKDESPSMFNLFHNVKIMYNANIWILRSDNKANIFQKEYEPICVNNL